jgi:hypothetical protein
MKVKVFIWERRLSIASFGHASMLVDSTYISWWPGEAKKIERSKINKIGLCKLKSDKEMPFYCPKNLQEDIEMMGSKPDHEFNITGLNSKEILHMWDDILGKNKSITSRWKPVSKFIIKTFFPRQEKEMSKEYFEALWKGKKPKYNLAFMNCTHIVYLCLKSGGFGEILKKRRGKFDKFIFNSIDTISDIYASFGNQYTKIEPRMLLSFLNLV